MKAAAVAGAVLFAAFAGTSDLAHAQVDCAQLMPDMQPRCMAINHMNERCSGKDRKERQACERAAIEVTPIEDCAKVAPQARQICEAHNRYSLQMQRCNDKRGNDYTACRQASALNRPLNR
jgi:hypothetical protein